jgi:hypothetical protein
MFNFAMESATASVWLIGISPQQQLGEAGCKLSHFLRGNVPKVLGLTRQQREEMKWNTQPVGNLFQCGQTRSPFPSL